jgi:hypothetical protein
MKVPTASGPELRVGGEMINDIATANGLPNGCAIANIGCNAVNAMNREMFD